MSIVTNAIPAGCRAGLPRRRMLAALFFAIALPGCGSTEPAGGTTGRYMLAGCTYPSQAITTPQKCNWADFEWKPDASYYDLGPDGRATLVLTEGLPSLGSWFTPSIKTGSWTESAGTVTLTWDGADAPFPRTVERIDAVTLRDAHILPDTHFWFVKAP